MEEYIGRPPSQWSQFRLHRGPILVSSLLLGMTDYRTIRTTANSDLVCIFFKSNDSRMPGTLLLRSHSLLLNPCSLARNWKYHVDALCEVKFLFRGKKGWRLNSSHCVRWYGVNRQNPTDTGANLRSSEWWPLIWRQTRHPPWGWAKIRRSRTITVADVDAAAANRFVSAPRIHGVPAVPHSIFAIT